MTDCLFCKMVAGDIKPDVVYETDDVLAFRDIRPQARVHVLVIPKGRMLDGVVGLLDDAGKTVVSNSRHYVPSIADPEIEAIYAAAWVE